MALTAEDRERRRHHLGSSDAAAILGLDPFRSATDCYWSKVVSMPEENKPQFDLGNRLEQLICEWGADRLGVQIERSVFKVSQGRDGGVMAANFDALIVGKPWGLEAKFSSQATEWGDDEGTDAVPERVLVQAAHQLHVGNLERVYVPALIIGYTATFRLYAVERSEELIETLIDRELAFWREHVEPQIPPDGWNVPPLAALKARHREPQSVVDLGPEAAEVWDDVEVAREAVRVAEADKDRCTAAVVALLAEAEGGRLPDGRLITYLEQRSAPRMDYAQFRACHPEIYETFVSQGAHRVLRIKDINKKKGR